jgi:hypothetical protein
LEEKLSNKFKNGHENFSGVRISMGFETSCLDNLKPCSLEIYKETFFMRIFELFGKKFFQNDVFKLKKKISEHEIRVFLENRLGNFQTFLILKILDKPEALKKNPNKVLKLWFS